MPHVGAGTARSGNQPGYPVFSLYGEASQLEPPWLHLEAVASRSARFDWEIDRHVHPALYQLVWVGQGQATAWVEEQTWDLPTGWAVVVPPGFVHGFRFAADSNGWVLTLSSGFLAAAASQPVGEAFKARFSRPQRLCLRTADTPGGRAAALMAQLALEVQADPDLRSPVPQWLALAVVWHGLQAAAADPQGAQAQRRHRHQVLFNRFVDLVEEHLLEHWPLPRYAQALGVSPPVLNRLVRAQRGISALELVHERLTREACRRLVFVPAPACKLALDLGFEDAAYFSRFFRRRTGLSPQDYRRLHQRSANGPAAAAEPKC